MINGFFMSKNKIITLSIALFTFFSFFLLSNIYSDRFVISDIPSFIILFFFIIGFSVSFKIALNKIFKLNL